jgi:hypothetical protein
MHKNPRIERIVFEEDPMTIQIPDDLARNLEGIAATQKKSVEQVAVERLRSIFDGTASPGALLRSIRKLPHPSPPAVDDLEAAIAAARLPVGDSGFFESWPEK